MVMLQAVLKIEEVDKKESILSIVSDKYCRKILDCISQKQKSITEVAHDTNIPISTVYRRIQALHDVKLVATSGQISDDGKKFFLYKSKVRSIISHFIDGHVSVEIIYH